MKEKKIKKEWGHEVWLANNEKENYCGKILSIKAGKSTSMHFHANKHESFYVLEGSLFIHTVDTQTTEITLHCVEAGERFVMDRVVPHKLEAQDGPVKFIEISTFHQDSDSDRVYR